MKKQILASIELDNEEGRGSIFAEREMIDGNQRYIIRVELPDGTIEEPAIAPQNGLKAVKEAIEASWGGSNSPWDLQWEA